MILQYPTYLRIKTSRLLAEFFKNFNKKGMIPVRQKYDASKIKLPRKILEKINQIKSGNGKIVKEDKIYMAGAEPFFIYASTKIGVLLLHGFTSTPAQFLELGDYLAGKGITVYAPLIAGHGTSPDDLSQSRAEEWLESCQKAFDELKNKVDKVFVLGNSFGGNIAFELSLKNPEKVSGVISIGTPVWVRKHHFLKLQAFSYGFLKKYWRKPKRYYRSGFAHIIDEITYSKVPVRACREFFKFIYKSFRSFDKVTAPTLIIQAEIDPVVNPKSALHIHECISSQNKKICWIDGSTSHALSDDKDRGRVYKKIYNFVQEVAKNEN
ncbi:alpha/beta fold hydrolase [Candidatus Parcubacteria bacterium]|nr:MAG: alpha/beta fold hydrolase [Candidatus Parcubacteria bacterium]